MDVCVCGVAWPVFQLELQEVSDEDKSADAEADITAQLLL